MNLLEEAKAVARAGTPADGVAFIERAADEGDPEGNLLVAHWLLYGSDRPRDAEAAYRRLELAAQEGNAHAARMRAYLTANGTGVGADEAKALDMLREIAASDAMAAEQLEFLPRMMSFADASKAARERVSSDPHIETVRKLLTPEECAYLMRRAEPILRPSHIHDPASDFG